MTIKQNLFLNKVAVISGGACGIGKNIALAFAREGAHVAICDINSDQGMLTVEEMKAEGASASFHYVDLGLRGAPAGMVKQVEQECGRLDVLVNNARAGQRKGLFEENEDSWEESIAVTLKAAFFASQEAIRAMSKSGGGNIINISSVASFVACPESPIYHIAKAGMLQMTRYLAAQSGGFGVRVNAISPGFIVRDEHKARYDRDDNRHYRDIAEFCHPVNHVGCSDDIANAVLFLCSPDASFITGQNITVDGGLTIQEQSSLLFRFANNEKNV